VTFFPEPDYLEHVTPCPFCDDRWCNLCQVHWKNCECPGPGFRACVKCKEIFVGRLKCVCGSPGEPI
jgi:hypothetical protein